MPHDSRTTRCELSTVAYASPPPSFEPPDFHSPRALASTERNRPPRKPTIAAGLRSGSSTADATFTTSAPSGRCGNNSSVNKNVPGGFVANVESHPTEFCVACFCLTPALLNTPAMGSFSATISATARRRLARLREVTHYVHGGVYPVKAHPATMRQSDARRSRPGASETAVSDRRRTNVKRSKAMALPSCDGTVL